MEAELNLRKIKFAAFDLDGTLIDDRGELIGDVHGAVNMLRQRGIIPIIVTGRTYDSFFSLDLDRSLLALFHHDVLLNDGNVICHHEKKTFEVKQYVDAALCQQIITSLDGKAEFVMESHGKHVASSKSAKLKYCMLYSFPREKIEVGHKKEFNFERVTKLFILPKEKVDLARQLKDCHCDVADAQFLNAQVISPKGICKADMLEHHLFDCFGERDFDRVIAFGNGHNDRLMLKKAKWGLAVQDSHPSAIELSDVHLQEPISDYLFKVLQSFETPHVINEKGGI
ncbi:HAD hydrolase family protein [Bacillus altitudinis]|uniref:HAD hydrolase family protein n=1 Tax=Bacillus altitudinis TaxID=293387 RepID=UPI003315A0A4